MTLVRFNTQPTYSGILDQLFFNQANGTGKSEPSVNIINQEDSFIVELTVPGYSKEEISINLEQQTLRVTAEAKQHEQEDDKFLRREFSLNGINRSFSLPKNIDTDNISADFRDGILKITLPRRKDEVLRKEISIS